MHLFIFLRAMPPLWDYIFQCCMEIVISQNNLECEGNHFIIIFFCSNNFHRFPYALKGLPMMGNGSALFHTIMVIYIITFSVI